LLAATLVAACADDQSGTPMPERRPTRFELHGDVRVDNYFWLKARENPKEHSLSELVGYDRTA
jgi:protease II